MRKMTDLPVKPISRGQTRGTTIKHPSGLGPKTNLKTQNEAVVGARLKVGRQVVTDHLKEIKEDLFYS